MTHVRAVSARRRGRAAAIALLVALAASACGRVVVLEPGDPVEFVQQPQTSHVLAADGTVLAELHTDQDRQDVGIQRMPPHLVAAVVAIEDRRFFLHRGVDLPAIARALLRNVEAGQVEEGGSTITQQYVKNTMLGSARTLDRKLREAALAVQLEQRYRKDEILERYLNTIYFGHGAYGVHAAARRYFGQQVEDLGVAESALLAGLIASPGTFDPHDDPERALARRRVVLDAMVAMGALSAHEADVAAEEPLALAALPTDRRALTPHVVEEVKRYVRDDPDGVLADVLGPTRDDRMDALFTGGLRVHTTLDLVWQAQAEAAVATVLTDPDDPYAALVAIDPRTGAIRALVGGRDFHDPDDPHAHFNLATQGRRQPGSAFKPVVLATALARGVSLEQVFPAGSSVTIDDARTCGPPWTVSNYGDIAYGEVTLREATVHSVNTVYARLVAEMGPVAVVQTARNLGHRADLPLVCSLGLGTVEVSPLELAALYAPLATLGVAHPTHLVARVETADGEVLYARESTGQRVLDEAVAYLVTNTLEEVVRRGTGVRALIGRPQAGKTGTSQSSADAWFVGFTPDLVAAVWVGFPEGRVAMVPPRTRVLVEGGRWPAEIWGAFASAALDGTTPEAFPTPEVDVVIVEVDLGRNCLPNPYTPPEAIGPRQYLRGTEPTERCREPTGPPVHDVPGVVGLPHVVAVRLLEGRGLVVDLRPEASRLYPPGVVTRQRPEEGGTTRPEDGNAVILWVSVAGRERALVPDVTGLHLRDAWARLEAEGWVVEARSACPQDGCPDDAPAQVVWDQSPPGGTRERLHSAIQLLVYPDP